MLFKNTVEKDTLSILETLQKDERLSNFYLVGGTALALNMGHRKSIDLDMFSPTPFDTEHLMKYLSEKYEFARLNPFVRMSKVILQGKIKDVKVDWVVNAYPFVEYPETIEEIRMYSLKDIAAMKLIAIADSGKRLKDFLDVAYLSTIMSFNEMLDAFGKKYNVDFDRVVRGLTYYNDIKFDEKIDLIDATYRFEPINERLHDMKRHPDKIYPDFPITKKSEN
jgi:histidyl-tRNA synthetase